MENAEILRLVDDRIELKMARFFEGRKERERGEPGPDRIVLAERFVRVEEAIKAQGERFHLLSQQMDRHIEQADKGIEQVNKRIEQVDKRIDQVDKRIDGMQIHFDKRIEQVDKRIDGMQIHIDKRFEQVDKRFEQVDKRFDGMLQQMDKRFEQVDKRFEQVERRFTSMQWLIGFGFVLLSGLMSLYHFVR